MRNPEMTQPTVKVKRLHPSAQLPAYETPGAAGADVRACLYGEQYVVIAPKSRKLIKTALAMEIPSGYEIQVRPRSGLALKHGITVLNTPGTIDSDYKQEIGIILVNQGDEPFVVRDGDRIAQIIIAACVQMIVEEASEIDANGRGGFGSTGVK